MTWFLSHRPALTAAPPVASRSVRVLADGPPARFGLRRALAVAARCLALAALAASSPAQAQVSDKISSDVADAVDDGRPIRVVVALQSPAYQRARLADLPAVRSEVARLRQSVLATLPRAGHRSHQAFETVPALVVTLLSRSALDALRAHPAVRRVDPDVGGQGGLAGSVALIRADLRQSAGNTGAGVVVAVLDSGIDTDHPDFAGRIVHEACFLDNDGAIDGLGRCPNGSDRQSGSGAAEDDHGHGTHVSGIVASGGTVSSVGVAPGAGLVAVKVLNSNNGFSFFSEIVAALDYVSANPQLGVKVVNMSLGTFALFAGDCDTAAAFTMAGAAAVNTLRANGVTTFASAGNNGSGTGMGAPACLRNVISVGATDNADTVAAFSNSNASTDLFAPGVSIVSSARGGGTVAFSGTSMASPHAAGCAALLLQAGDALTPDAIEARMETSTVQVTDLTNGLTFPRLDCSPAPSAPPVASAGADQTVVVGQTVALDGSASTGALTFAWTLAPSGTLSDATAASPTFCAAAPVVYTATLIVSDATASSAPDAATVTAVTATAALDALAAQVEALRAAGVLNAGQARGLSNTLTAARRHVARGRTAGALEALAGFRAQALSLWQNDGVLTQAQATALATASDAVAGALAAPCSAAPAFAAAKAAGDAAALGLGAAYPNPASSGVTVPFALDAASHVRLSVFDALGREVAVLVEGVAEAGLHEARLETRGLAPGVYLVRLTTGGGLAQSQRLTLLR